MDAKAWAALRPRDATAAGIESSITRMGEALTEIKGELAANQGARRGALLTDIERISASIEALQPELAVARGKERLADLETIRVEAERLAGVFAGWWHADYERLARAIAAGLELERAAHRARNEFAEAAASAARDSDVAAAITAGATFDRDVTRTPLAHFSTNAHGSAQSMVCLPSVEAGAPIFWPMGFVRERIKTGEAALYA